MTDKDRARSASRRLAIIRHAREVSHNVALTCRYYGITRQTYYLWLWRYVEKGVPGLEDRSRRPHRSTRATSTEIVGKIVHLRQTYHFGPQKIAMYLKRYHELVVSTSGIWRILRRSAPPRGAAGYLTGFLGASPTAVEESFHPLA